MIRYFSLWRGLLQLALLCLNFRGWLDTCRLSLACLFHSGPCLAWLEISSLCWISFLVSLNLSYLVHWYTLQRRKNALVKWLKNTSTDGDRKLKKRTIFSTFFWFFSACYFLLSHVLKLCPCYLHLVP